MESYTCLWHHLGKVVWKHTKQTAKKQWQSSVFILPEIWMTSGKEDQYVVFQLTLYPESLPSVQMEAMDL